jgi:hypothetical protein
MTILEPILNSPDLRAINASVIDGKRTPEKIAQMYDIEDFHLIEKYK